MEPLFNALTILILDLMEEAKEQAIQSIEGRTIVYSAMGKHGCVIKTVNLSVC